MTKDEILKELQNYYLIKCFEKEDYRNSFNKGKNLYINHVSAFHTMKNKFQKDTEGGIYEYKYTKAIAKFPTATDFVVKGYRIGEVTATVHCHICCFYILQKNKLLIAGEQIQRSSQKTQDELFIFLSNYLGDDKKSFPVSIYDAGKFMRIFVDEMEKRHYLLDFGVCSYKNLSDEEKSDLILNNNFGRLLMTKKEEFSYQNEFRIIVKSDNELPIQEKGIDFSCSVVADFEYVGYEYFGETINKTKDDTE